MDVFKLAGVLEIWVTDTTFVPVNVKAELMELLRPSWKQRCFILEKSWKKEMNLADSASADIDVRE